MVRACVEEGWWACVEKSIGVWTEGQEEERTTKGDLKDASGKREQECWFGEGGCLESSEMESGSWRDCCQGGVNLATSIYGDKARSKIGWWWWKETCYFVCVFQAEAVCSELYRCVYLEAQKRRQAWRKVLIELLGHLKVLKLGIQACTIHVSNWFSV